MGPSAERPSKWLIVVMVLLHGLAGWLLRTNSTIWPRVAGRALDCWRCSGTSWAALIG